MSLGGLNFLLGEDIVINDQIKIHQPTLKELSEMGEKEYFDLVGKFVARPSDYMSQLDDIGIDYETITDYQLFLQLIKGMQSNECKLLFGELDFASFSLAKSPDNEEVILWNKENSVMINETIYSKIADVIRTMHYFPKTVDKPGNKSTKKYLISVERKKLQRLKNKPFESVLEDYVSSLVNCCDCPYDYQSIQNLKIYQFYTSLKRIQKLQSFLSLMNGVYFGTVDINKINKEELNWCGRLK